MSSSNRPLTYRYNPNDRSQRSIAEDWIVDRYDVDVSPSQDYDASTSSFFPMRRFMGETDLNLFHFTAQPNTEKLPPFQSLDIAPYAYPTSTSWPYTLGPELPSPSLSGPSSNYFSSSASDRQDTPASPLEHNYASWSPEIVHADHFGFSFGGGHDMFHDQKTVVGHPCVALNQVQSYEDPQPEKMAYEDDTPYFGSYASATHEGYELMETSGDAADAGAETDGNDSKDSDYNPPSSPNIRRRRPQPSRTVTSPRATSKVTKRGHVRRSSAPQAKTSSQAYSNNVAAASSNRAFPCALAQYGCPSTFGSKNEWKRHVNTQHMRLAYWRCDQCDLSSKRPNDFNRKDLFIQHVRRMHPVEATTPTTKKATSKQSGKAAKGTIEEQTLNDIADRCVRQDRFPPVHSGCHFCPTTFEMHGTGVQAQWDKRLEHVAQHMENGKKSENSAASDFRTWKIDGKLQEWLVETGIVVTDAKGALVLA